MRLPSRWVTNPGSTLKAKSGPHSEVRSFFVPADMGRGCIGHPPAQGTGPPVPAGGGRQASARLRAEENASFLSYPHTLRAPRSRAADNKTPRPEEKRNSRKGKSPQKRRGEVQERQCGEAVQGRRCRRETMQGRDDAAHREKAEPPIQGTRTTDSPKTTTYPENPAPLKKPGSPGKPRLLPEKPQPARIRKKTPAGRCRE